MVKHFVGSICALILNFTLFRGGKNEIIAVEALTTLSNHTDWVKSMAFHPTQPLLASGSGDNTVKIYKIIDAKRERRLRCLKEMCRGLDSGKECNDPILCYLWHYNPPLRYTRLEQLKVGHYRKQILCFINFN